jgi:hypothetical protein
MLDKYLELLTKQASSEETLKETLKTMSFGELAKLAGVKLAGDVCAKCGSHMPKKGEMYKCACGMMKSAAGNLSEFVDALRPYAHLADDIPILAQKAGLFRGDKKESRVKTAESSKETPQEELQGRLDKITDEPHEPQTSHPKYKDSLGERDNTGKGEFDSKTKEALDPKLLPKLLRSRGVLGRSTISGIIPRGLLRREATAPMSMMQGAAKLGSVGLATKTSSPLGLATMGGLGFLGGYQERPTLGGAAAGVTGGLPGGVVGALPGWLLAIGGGLSGKRHVSVPGALLSLLGMGAGSYYGGRLGGKILNSVDPLETKKRSDRNIQDEESTQGAEAQKTAFAGGLIAGGKGLVRGIMGQSARGLTKGMAKPLAGTAKNMMAKGTAARQWMGQNPLATAGIGAGVGVVGTKLSSALVEIGDKAGRLLAKSAGLNDTTVSPEELEESIGEAQEREDIPGRSRAWQIGGGVGGGAVGSLPGLGLMSLSKRPMLKAPAKSTMLTRLLTSPKGIRRAGLIAAPLGALGGAYLGQEWGKQHGAEEAAADKAGRLLAKSAGLNDTTVSPDELEESIGEAQEREDIPGRSRAWQIGGGFGGGLLGTLPAVAIHALDKKFAPASVLSRRIITGGLGVTGAGLGAQLGSRWGKQHGAEEAAADKAVSLLRALRAHQAGQQSGFGEGLRQGSAGMGLSEKDSDFGEE